MKKITDFFNLEIILSVIFFIIPIILPLIEGSFLPSISDYAYSSANWFYNHLLTISGLILAYDGFKYTSRKYNILIGLSLVLVVLFPVLEYRITHDIFAIIFFVGNAYIVTYYSKLLNIKHKIFFSTTILITLTFLFFDYINLYVAESIGFFSMSYFMYFRHSMIKLRENLNIS